MENNGVASGDDGGAVAIVDLDALTSAMINRHGPNFGYSRAMEAVRRHAAKGGTILIRCWEGSLEEGPAMTMRERVSTAT